MQCRTMPSQRPCGWSECEREDCKTLRTIARIRQRQNEKLMGDGILLEAFESLQRVIALTSGRPGFHTITVKELLRAISGEDE